METTSVNDDGRATPFGLGRDWVWMLGFYLVLAIILGAVSFFGRPREIGAEADRKLRVQSTATHTPQLQIAEAVHLQRKIWESFQVKGSAAEDRADYVYRVNSTRILMPALNAFVVRVTGLGWDKVFSLLRLMLIALTLLTFHWYLRRWFDVPIAMLGTLIMAATLPLTFNIYYELPTDFPEILAYTIGLWCILERRYALLCLTIIIGTLNRETTIFLPLILLLDLFGKVSFARLTALCAATGFSWLIPTLLLKWWTGIELLGGHGDMMPYNIAGLARFFENLNPYNFFLYYLYLFGIFWVLPLVRWRRQPPFFRRALLSLPVFIIIYLFFGGVLSEPREIVNLYPLLIPAGIFALFGEQLVAHSSVEAAGNLQS